MFYLDKKHCSNIVCGLIAMVMLFLPILKGGNYPGAMSLFICVMLLVFLLSLKELSNQRALFWFFPWCAFTVSVVIHAFVVPEIWGNERFFETEVILPSAFFHIDQSSLIGIRTLEVWSFFTAMWIFAWRVSLMAERHVKVLLLVLVVIVFFQACYGVMHFISGSSSVLGLWTKEYYLSDATGTFVNRNHFSGMLAITLPLILSGLLSRKPLIFLNLSRVWRALFSIIVGLVVMMALILANSRMGMVAALFGITVCSYFLISQFSSLSKQSSGKRLFRYIGVCVFVLLFAIWFGLEDILRRYVDLGGGNSRLDVWRAMLDMPMQVWLVGVGPGLYEDISLIINPSHFNVKFITAHNDYLEFFFEFGLVLGGCILAVFLYFFKKEVSFLKGQSALKAGIYGSISAISLHSFVDFNMQIAGSAIFFWFSIGLLLNSNLRIAKENESSEQSSNNFSKLMFEMPKTKREWLAFFRSD